MRSIGIDFGTSTSEVALCDDGQEEILPDRHGDVVIASMIAFAPGNKVLIGNRAKARMVIDPANTVHSFKRIIGLPSNAPQVRQYQQTVPFELKLTSGQPPQLVTRGGGQTPFELAQRLFRYLASYPGIVWSAVANTVVTVPASFKPEQAQAIVDAARGVGLKDVAVINEAYAAALPYLDSEGPQRNVLTYDLGGGTFDVSVLRARGLATDSLAYGGDPCLGGNDIDRNLAQRVAADVLREHRFDLEADTVSFGKLLLACERAKVILSNHAATRIDLGQIHPALEGRSVEMLRKTADECIYDVSRRTFVLLDEVLGKAGLEASHIDQVILAGGSTNIPSIREAIGTYFGRQPRADLPPDRVVALGASLAAGLRAGQRPAPRPAGS